jgi:predicted MPP superfamily phosphohydrolase
MAFLLRFVVGIVLVVLIDLYFYQAIALLIANLSPFKKIVIRNIYWGFTAYTILLLLIAMAIPFQEWWPFARIYLFAFAIILLICKLIGSTFILVDDLTRLIRWLFNLVFTPTANTEAKVGNLSRLKFLNQLALVMAAIPFSAFIYGMIKSGFDYKVRKVRLVLPNLPAAFNGLKIVQLSDIHTGSFVSSEPLEKALRMIQEQNADVIFFTGDLVNNITEEAIPYTEIFKQVKAPLGVFSTLGNHDYGDYVQWPSVEAKQKNFEDIKNLHAEFGWKLLMNEHIILKKGDAEIAVLGVENWGAAMRFPKYGDLKKAHAGTENFPVKLLLSHDPSHWDAQVRKQYPDIDLTFSGHTHGMQFGIEIPGFRWSPSKYIYKQWADLYQEGKQFLYVNRGLGFLGYPGRVGILPEITVVELHNA